MMYAQRRVTQFRAVCHHCRRMCPSGWRATEGEAAVWAEGQRWQRVLLGVVNGWVCGACLDLPFAEVVERGQPCRN